MALPDRAAARIQRRTARQGAAPTNSQGHPAMSLRFFSFIGLSLLLAV